MNESYPSHSVPQQNPMKHCPSHRVALMHPMSHRRVKGVSMGPRNSSLRPVLVAVGSPFLLHLLHSALMPAGIYMLAQFLLFPFPLLGFPSDQPHSFLTSHCLRLFAKIIKFLARTEPVPPEMPPVISNLLSKCITFSGAGNQVDPHTLQ